MIIFFLLTACLNVSCENGGECIDGACVCQPWWTGQFCESGILILLEAKLRKAFVIVLLVLLHMFYNMFHRARRATYFSDRPQIPGCTPICQPISSACIMTPFLTQILHPMTRFSLQSTPSDFFFQNVNVMFQIFRAVCAHFKTFCQFSAEKKNPNLHSNWEVHTKKGPFFLGGGSHTQRTPFFYEIIHRMRCVFVLM